MVPDPEVFVGWAKERGIAGSYDELCQNPVSHRPPRTSVDCCWFSDDGLLVPQHAKRAVLEDMRAVGKDAGLKSFEQVRRLLPTS